MGTACSQSGGAQPLPPRGTGRGERERGRVKGGERGQGGALKDVSENGNVWSLNVPVTEFLWLISA